MYKLLEISPSSFIVESWKELGITARNKVKEFAPSEKRFKNPLQRPFIYLENKGALIPSTAKAIHDMRNLKNNIVHSENIRISKEDAIEYSSLSRAIIKQIESIRELPKIKLTALTLLILELNHLIDTGKYNNIKIEDIHVVIEKKRILPYLEETTKGDADFSLFGNDGPYTEFVKYFHEQMYQIYGGYAGNERRKWGIENLGLCLLLAWTNEIVQRCSGWYPELA